MNPSQALLLRHYFPLVARPKPLCPPLPERVEEVAGLARAAGADNDLAAAASAGNRAALIASDCGIPELAARWCQQHFQTYWSHRPLRTRAASFALEPLINLARLHIRAHQGGEAHRILVDLYRTVRDQTAMSIGGRALDFAGFAADGEAHRTAVTKLWTVLLSDASRALTAAGDWTGALDHVTRHKGVGRRLLDGRQIAVIARHIIGDHVGVHRLLTDTAPTEPWEHVVAGILDHVCGGSDAATTRTAVASYLDLDGPAELLHFRVRLGLAILDACQAIGTGERTAISAHVTALALQSRDGYAARLLLAHPLAAGLTSREAAALHAAVTAGGLGAGTIPADQLTILDHAVDTAQQTARELLTDPAGVATGVYEPR